MIKVIIVDDESPARSELRFLLEQIKDVSVIGEAANGSAALKIISEIRPDVAFVDIQMPGLTGLELSKIISELKDPPLFVFATAFQDYAIKAFESEAFDYILKPFVFERVVKTISKASEYLEMKKIHDCAGGVPKPGDTRVKKILLYDEEKIIPTSPSQIIFARRERSAVVVKTVCGTFISRLTLNALEARLSKSGFVRTHRSSIVNVNYIQEVIPWFNGSIRLIMNDKEKTEIDVSRYNAKNLKNHFS